MEKVKQGWITSTPPNDSFSEAVVVYFDPEVISIDDLIAIHLHTHQCTSDHSMRSKYRSAVYYFDEDQKALIRQILNKHQSDFEREIITKTLPFKEFKPSTPRYQNYYQKEPERPFCRTYINPKLTFLLKQYSKLVNKDLI